MSDAAAQPDVRPHLRPDAPPADQPPAPSAETPDAAWVYVGVWLALLVLLAATMFAHALTTRYHTPTLGTGLGLGVAVAKAALVVWFFMHLRHHGGLTRIAAGAALLWFGLLLTLTLCDYLTRRDPPRPAPDISYTSSVKIGAGQP